MWPTVGAWSASTPGGDVILILGPEPALRWRLFTQQLISIAQRFDASMVLTLGALLADVPHPDRSDDIVLLAVRHSASDTGSGAASSD